MSQPLFPVFWMTTSALMLLSVFSWCSEAGNHSYCLHDNVFTWSPWLRDCCSCNHHHGLFQSQECVWWQSWGLCAERSIDQQFTSERSRLSNPTTLHPPDQLKGCERITTLSTYMPRYARGCEIFSKWESWESSGTSNVGRNTNQKRKQMCISSFRPKYWFCWLYFF